MTDELLGTSEIRKQQLRGMRDMLWFLEQNPDVPMPAFEFAMYEYTRSAVARLVRLLRPVERDISYGNVRFIRKFAEGVTLRVVVAQGIVCQQIEVDEKWVDGEPAKPATEGHFEKQYEYDCNPILTEEAK